jgi:hypothetical protein
VINARRDTERLERSLIQLVKNVKIGKHTVPRYLWKVESAGICHSRFGHSTLGDGVVEVTNNFRPYQRCVQETASSDSTEFRLSIR